ncbi:MAG: tetratricopeptide repeat protein [Bacteroidia bacterium]|nr:tetratricopeptide repeat protein [Bacteroidia bacterium]
MKRFVLVLISVFVFNALMAQPNEVVSAYNYWRYKELFKAKEHIDRATKHEKTMNLCKTWYYNGLIYQSMSDSCMFSKIKKFCDLVPDAADIAFNSYIKALVLNFKDPKWHTLDPMNKEADAKVFSQLMSDRKSLDDPEITMKIIGEIFPSLANVFVNKGVEKYKSTVLTDNEKAVDYFETSLFLSSMTRLDTPVVYYTALAAEKAKKYDKVVEYYTVLSKLLKPGAIIGKKTADYLKPNILYLGIANGYINQKDTIKYINALKEGMDKYPKESDLLVLELVKYYSKANKTAEELAFLKVAIEKSPGNYIYYFAQGSLYDNLNDEWKKLPINNIKTGMKKDDVIKLFGKPLDDKTDQPAKPASNPKTGTKGKSIQQTKPQIVTETLMYKNISVILENGVVKSWTEIVPTQKPDINYEDAAIKAYNKALEIKPDYFDAQYNLGALYYNKAVEYFTAANDIPSDQQQKYDQEIASAKEQLNLAKPYLEKAHSLNDKDVTTIQSLQIIYTRLQMYDKAKEMKDLLEKK